MVLDVVCSAHHQRESTAAAGERRAGRPAPSPAGLSRSSTAAPCKMRCSTRRVLPVRGAHETARAECDVPSTRTAAASAAEGTANRHELVHPPEHAPSALAHDALDDSLRLGVRAQRRPSKGAPVCAFMPSCPLPHSTRPRLASDDDLRCLRLRPGRADAGRPQMRCRGLCSGPALPTMSAAIVKTLAPLAVQLARTSDACSKSANSTGLRAPAAHACLQLQGCQAHRNTDDMQVSGSAVCAVHEAQQLREDLAHRRDRCASADCTARIPRVDEQLFGLVVLDQSREQARCLDTARDAHAPRNAR